MKDPQSIRFKEKNGRYSVAAGDSMGNPPGCNRLVTESGAKEGMDPILEKEPGWCPRIGGVWLGVLLFMGVPWLPMFIPELGCGGAGSSR